MGLPRSTFYDGPNAAADDAEIVVCIVATKVDGRL